MTDNRTTELEQCKYKPPYDARPMRMLRHHIECDCLSSRRGVLREIEDLFAIELTKRDERIDELELKYMEAGHVIERLTAECDKWKAKADKAGRAMNAAAGLWAKADAENRELQAKCDELNAELGSGTCRLHYGENDDGYDGWYCDGCGGWFQAVRRDGHLVEPKHCQECGKAVKR